MHQPDPPTSNPGPTDGASTPLWLETWPCPPLPVLHGDLLCDVVIVGAGIAGLTTAWLLVQEGLKVVVVDQATAVGAGQTGRTTAHIASALDDRYFSLEKMHGQEGARLAARSHSDAVTLIERIVQTEGIACDFTRVDGYLFRAPKHSQKLLERELEATQRCGLPTEMVERAPITTFDTGKCVRFPDQAQFHATKYLAGLAEAVIKRGGQIFGSCHVEDIKGGDGAHVKIQGGRVISAGTIVLATNTPIHDRLLIHTKQHAYRSYVIASRIPKGSVARALYWDTLSAYHYVRIWEGDPTTDWLIVGGEDHKTGQHGGEDPSKAWERLEEWTRERFPIGLVESRWSGQVMEPADGMGYIGHHPQDPENVFIITGDSGNGITHGTLGGMLVKDLIRKNDTPYATLYDPGRVTWSGQSILDYTLENLNTVGQYLDWIEPGDVKSADDVKPGEGAIVRSGVHLRAVYVDNDGVRHECSAMCPHLGGVVSWNKAEKTWDCPAHGSRFDATGKVVEGPAKTDLRPVDRPPR